MNMNLVSLVPPVVEDLLAFFQGDDPLRFAVVAIVEGFSQFQRKGIDGAIGKGLVLLCQKLDVIGIVFSRQRFDMLRIVIIAHLLHELLGKTGHEIDGVGLRLFCTIFEYRVFILEGAGGEARFHHRRQAILQHHGRHAVYAALEHLPVAEK